ncbi:MAG: hypothetical protein MUC48_16935 [Leptolyngbya sp. Prado105]|jgi:hypothetical protein|nr:hypothetical protein [Leptolyngbya sp. Prado105]
MSTCPCCSDRLLRHIRQGSLYWFCRTCWSEMPNLEEYDRPLSVATSVPTILQPYTLRSATSHSGSLHFAKVIRYERPGKTHRSLVVS